MNFTPIKNSSYFSPYSFINNDADDLTGSMHFLNLISSDVISNYYITVWHMHSSIFTNILTQNIKLQCNICHERLILYLPLVTKDDSSSTAKTLDVTEEIILSRQCKQAVTCVKGSICWDIPPYQLPASCWCPAWLTL
jgi:hypothetical protein